MFNFFFIQTKTVFHNQWWHTKKTISRQPQNLVGLVCSENPFLILEFKWWIDHHIEGGILVVYIARFFSLVTHLDFSLFATIAKWHYRTSISLFNGVLKTTLALLYFLLLLHSDAGKSTLAVSHPILISDGAAVRKFVDVSFSLCSMK